MSEIKYSKPLEYYTVDNFLKESHQMIGQPVTGIMGTSSFDIAKYDFTAAYALAVGDDNPLFRDVWYALNTRYETIIALPTFFIAIKYPMCEGPLFDGPYPLAGLEASYDWEWNDVIRMNDKFTYEHILTDVYEQTTQKGRTVYLVSECKYWNQLKELVATCNGTYAAIVVAESIIDLPEAIKEGFSKRPITDRKVHKYSDDEVSRIIKDSGAMVRNGPKSRYWENVEIGDELPQIVKAPVTSSSLIQYHNAVFTAQNFPNFEVHVRKFLKKPGVFRSQLLTNWPYDYQLSQYEDPYLGETGGLGYSFPPSSVRAGFCAHLLSNWMGDDGFIRSLQVDVSEPYLYGDSLWVKGTVVEKYKEKIAGGVYGAVDIKIESINQLGQNVAPGKATVYLPSKCRVVDLPIQQRVK